MRPAKLRAAAGGLAAAALLASGSDIAGQQDEALPERDGLTGLEWRFVRIRYDTPPGQLAEFKRIYWVDPWEVDAPVAEQNLSRRMARVTSLQVNEPIILELSDEALWEHPWIYIVEPANLMLTDAEVDILREFLLRGGTVTFDDFHGPREWALFEQQMARVFPDRQIVELPADHPVFSCFYRIDEYPQIAGLGSYFNNVTWEKGGFEAQLHGILDDDGRVMGARQLQHRHGGRLGVVQRGAVSRLHPVHRAVVPHVHQRDRLRLDPLSGGDVSGSPRGRTGGRRV